jgi:alcohol dehydrogenase class IV
MKQQTNFEYGAIGSLAEMLQGFAPDQIFLVTGKGSYESSGAEEALTTILQPYQTCHFCEFEVNPKIADVEQGLKLFRAQQFDVMIAVGGGSVLDMGKLINIFAAQDASSVEIVEDRNNIQRPGIPLIAVPTTSGSGSEATHFAVIYLGKAKYSVAHEYILPDMAIVDPGLTHSVSAKMTAVTGMDAFSQAVESFWSVNSTEQSRAYAVEAIRLVIDNLENAVNQPTNNEARTAMAKASHLAGRAINISKTTAPHAMSYTITSYFGVPHGHAVALTLGEMLVYNNQVDCEDVVDPRGVAYVHRTIGELNKLLHASDAAAARDKISDLMKCIGLETTLGELGIRRKAELELIVNSVNFERLANNPRTVTKSSIRELLQKIT